MEAVSVTLLEMAQLEISNGMETKWKRLMNMPNSSKFNRQKFSAIRFF